MKILLTITLLTAFCCMDAVAQGYTFTRPPKPERVSESIPRFKCVKVITGKDKNGEPCFIWECADVPSKPVAPKLPKRPGER